VKIGFYAYSIAMLGRYWQKLYEKADCWWGVPEKRMYDLLKKRNMKNIVHYHEEYLVDNNVVSGNKYIVDDPGRIQRMISEEINPDIWIADTANKLDYNLKKAFWVQTCHSLTIKKHFFYEPVLNYDLILLPGPYHRREFVKRLNLRENDERLKVVGWPRVDDLVNGSYERESIMKAIGLDPKKKTVMYAPTWGWGFGNNTFFARWFDSEIEVFEKLCRETVDQNLNLIVRLHSLSFHANNEELKEIGRRYSVVWQTNETSNFQDDPNPYLWITDILISDLSGIIADFMVLDRPVIYIDPDESVDPWDDCDMPKHFRAGYVVRTLEELCGAIKDSVHFPDRYSEERKLLTSKLFYKLDGNAADRAAKAILDFAESKGLK